MSPILNTPKKIMTSPAIFVRNEILDDNNVPNHVAEAPKRMKIIENPPIKNTELRTTVSFCLFSSPLPGEPTFISCRETPDIKEMYPGINGRTQGDKNDINPAANAMVMGTLCVMVIYTILPECLWQLLFLPKHLHFSGWLLFVFVFLVFRAKFLKCNCRKQDPLFL